MWLCKRDLSKECEGKYKDCVDCVLEKIRTEIEKLNPVDYGSIYSYESHNGARDMKDDVLTIIDECKLESEDE